MSIHSLCVVGVISVLAAQLPAQTHGAISTTNAAGQCVAVNHYQFKRDVFLTGGASALSPCSASQLADGQYYFQVTDPSGAWLLSKDSLLERWVSVSGGVVTAYLGRTHAARNNGACGSTTVRLVPYNDTPFAGGEYKVWLTPVADYDPAGSGFFGFHADRSVTDNFVIGGAALGTPLTYIDGYAFFDHNEDGVWNPQVDPLEVPLAGWRVELLREGVLDGLTFTDANGRYAFIRNRDGTTYKVREIAPGGFVGDGIVGAEWVSHTPREADVVADEELPPAPDFGVVSVELKQLVGRTKAWWNGEDGRYLLSGCDPQWRDSLTTQGGGPVSLRRSISSDDPAVSIYAPAPVPESFPTTYQDFSNYLSSAPLDHAGFLLSVEIAAAILNNGCGFMQFPAYIDRFQDGVLVPFDVMLAGAIGLLNQVGAGLTGPNDPYQDLRNHMLMCINEFGSINNTGDSSAPQVVHGRTSLPESFTTPY